MKQDRKWKERTTGVTWADVWQWAEDVYDRWGFETRVVVAPPLPSQRKSGGTVLVELYIMGIADPREGTKHRKWRQLPVSGARAEETALQLLVEMHRSLDQAEWEAARQAETRATMPH